MNQIDRQIGWCQTRNPRHINMEPGEVELSKHIATGLRVVGASIIALVQRRHKLSNPPVVEASSGYECLYVPTIKPPAMNGEWRCSLLSRAFPPDTMRDVRAMHTAGYAAIFGALTAEGLDVPEELFTWYRDGFYPVPADAQSSSWPGLWVPQEFRQLDGS